MKYHFFAISAFICIFAFLQTHGMTNDTVLLPCEEYNNTNCTACLKNIMCFWCDETQTCNTVDFVGFISNSCAVEGVFVTQCVLNGLYSIIVIAAAVLLLVGVFLCLCVTCCICCCWCMAKKKNYTEDKQQLQMEQIKDSKETKKLEREQMRQKIRDKYL